MRKEERVKQKTNKLIKIHEFGIGKNCLAFTTRNRSPKKKNSMPPVQCFNLV